MSDPSEIYTREWCEAVFPEIEAEYGLLAVPLRREFGASGAMDVLDVGCGPGILLDEFHRLGCGRMLGIDGSRHTLEYARRRYRGVWPYLRLGDLREEVDLPGRFDLVVCTEVAEHLEATHARALVELLARGCKPSGAIFFTAAPPGQGGHDHVNEQPMDYWADRFAERGFALDGLASDRIRLALGCLERLWWIRNNCAVFRPIAP